MGSEEAIADEKAWLFAGMRPGAVAVLNRDSRHYDRLVRHARHFGVARIVGFGRHEAAEARLRRVPPAGFGQRRRSLDPRTGGSSIA